MRRSPPIGAPEGTVWFGGPVDRWIVSLWVHGPDLDPDYVSDLLGCKPTRAAARGMPFPKTGRWILRIDSRDCDADADVSDGIAMLLKRLPTEPAVWDRLADTCTVSVSCGLFMSAANRGFAIPHGISKALSDLGLDVGFDIYFDPPADLPIHD